MTKVSDAVKAVRRKADKAHAQADRQIREAQGNIHEAQDKLKTVTERIDELRELENKTRAIIDDNLSKVKAAQAEKAIIAHQLIKDLEEILENIG